MSDNTHKRWIKRRQRYPLIDIGGGPYRVLAECRSELHNTLAAKRGRRTIGGIQYSVEKCICPQAVWLGKQETQARRERDKARLLCSRKEAAQITRGAGKFRSAMFVNSLANSVPDLRGAACANKIGQTLIDEIAKNNAGERELKILCGACPVRERCAGWALSSERNVGEWGLIYGGMNPSERFTRKTGHRRGERGSAA